MRQPSLYTSPKHASEAHTRAWGLGFLAPWAARSAAALLLTMLLAPASASAQDRLPDLGVLPDSRVAHYGLIGVGDLTGDGRNDLLIQGTLKPINPQSTRWVDLYSSPLPDFGGDAVSPVRTVFNLARGSTTLNTALADLNGDGIQDVLFADTTRRGIESVERQKVSVLFGREDWKRYYFVGESSRGDRKLERKVALSDPTLWDRASRITVRGADLNDDGYVDLVVGIDPPAPAGGGALDRPDPDEGESEVLIMFGDGRWLFWEEADPVQGREADWVDRGPLRPDVRITGLGHCARSLGDIADVTGDGRPDLLLRRCPGGNLPDLPGIVPGREDWPAEIQIDGAVVETAVMPSQDSVGAEASARPLALDLVAGLPDPGGLILPVTLDPRSQGLDYLRESERRPDPSPLGFMPAPPPLLGRDLSGDGVADVLLGGSADMHVWLGGEDIGARMLTGRSDRIYLGASLAGAALSDAWAPADLDGDGDLELPLARHVPPPDGANAELPPPGPLHVFDGDWQSRDVLDLSRGSPAAAATWQHPSLGLAGIADVDGDGRSDVLVATHPAADEARLGIILGPFLR